jgi:glycosyltransferase involved in cell wall biosynthesis
MASGTPVIASNSTSLPEVVGSAGLLVDPLNIEEVALAIEAITQSGSLRDRCIDLGLKRAKQFTWEKCAQKTLEVYLKAVST